MDKKFELFLRSRKDSRQLSKQLGALLEPGDVVFLEGELGTGKTFLARGLCRTLGVPIEVPIQSPTFALVHEYQGRLNIVHADLYRLVDASSVLELGLLEMVARRDCVVLIEWAKRFQPDIAVDGVLIELSYHDKYARNALLSALGPRGESILENLPRTLGKGE